MNTLDTISALISPQTMSGQMPVDHYKQLWMRAYQQAAGANNKRYFKLRLSELETWDTCNGKENERQGKIQALQTLLNN